MFEAILSSDDAARATAVVDELFRHAFSGALTGGLAIATHLRAHGRRTEQRRLNDIDFVVETFASIPESFAERFLLHHIHPFAPEGKLLLQLIDPECALRIDLFRARGSTLSRGTPCDDTGLLHVVAVEDLVARTTAHPNRREEASA